MSGFNRITQIQPARSGTPTVLGIKPNTINAVINRAQHVQQMTPMKRPQLSTVNTSTPAKRPTTVSTSRGTGFITPVNKVVQPNHHNAPIKKRSLEPQHHEIEHDESYTNGVVIESPSILDGPDQVDEDHEIDYDDFPANQMGFYENGFDSPPQANDGRQSSQEKENRVAFERVKEETVEMGGFILPGSEKNRIHKSYNWIAGRSDGQYRVVLGYNTLFKPKTKNGIDAATGEKDSSRWRVVRFENRYKENYPYTEFPAKYLTPIIQALEKARETHDLENKEEAIN